MNHWFQNLNKIPKYYIPAKGSKNTFMKKKKKKEKRKDQSNYKFNYKFLHYAYLLRNLIKRYIFQRAQSSQTYPKKKGINITFQVSRVNLQLKTQLMF